MCLAASDHVEYEFNVGVSDKVYRRLTLLDGPLDVAIPYVDGFTMFKHLTNYGE